MMWMSRGRVNLLEAITSNTDLIHILRQGAKHPTEIAKEFDITRVAVDKRLKKLKKHGLVDPKPCVSKNSDRPIIKYELSEACIKLLDSIDDDVDDFYRQKVRELDILLVTNEIEEEEYLMQREKLDGEIRKVKKDLI
jgi:predicted ArsR family transcriptional regulator